MKIDVLYIIIGLLFVTDLVFVILLFCSKGRNRRRNNKFLENKKLIIEKIADSENTPDLSLLRIKPEIVFRIYKDIRVSALCSEKVSHAFIDYFITSGIADRFCKAGRSRNKIRRSRAVLNMAFLPADKIKRALEAALVNERYYFIKVYIINSLIETGDEHSIPYILQTLIGSPQWYKEKIYSLVGQFGERLHRFLINAASLDYKELKMVIISFADYYISPDIKNLLVEFMASDG